MPLFRANSAKSTLSMMQRKATKYKKFLNLSNVFLLIASTILIFTAIILMKFYHIDKLDFWSVYFPVVPVYKITLGVYTFVVCLFGFFISGYEKRIFIAIYAILLALAFIAQLGSIFIALELRTTVAQENIGIAAVNEDLNLYGVNSFVTSKWDDLQRDLHCCGGHNFGTGYNDYRSTPIGNNMSVPDSCCHTYSPGCGADVFKETHEKIRIKIFVDGCLTFLKDQLEREVVPILVAYACVGVILALVELITVVLACAHVAQITRRLRREEKSWRIHKEDRIGDAADGHTSEHETMC